MPVFLLAQVNIPEEYLSEKDLHPAWLHGNPAESVFPDAEVLIIQDYSWVHFELYGSNPQVRYEHLRRVKIVEQETSDHASLSFEVSRENEEALVNWEAFTYGINAEEEIIQFPVEKKSLVADKQGDKIVYRLNFPFVRAGSVIELRYEVKTSQIEELRTWNFQRELPVLRSAVTTYIPFAYEYLVVPKGDLSSMVRAEGSFDNHSRQLKSAALNNGPNISSDNLLKKSSSGNVTAYLMMEVPALQAPEAFAPAATDDYIPSLSWLLSQDYLMRQSNEDLFASWGQLDRIVARRFRRKRVPRKVRKAISREIASTSSVSRTEAIQLIYKRFADFSWDGSYAVVPTNPGRTFRDESGNSADINFLMMSALREAGFEVQPVVMSTRDHGYAQGLFPILTQFNHVLVAYENEGEVMLLDAVGGMEKAGTLPTNDLNGHGYKLSGSGGEWVPLQSYQKINQVTYSRFSLRPDGRMDGEVSVVNKDFSTDLELKKLDDLDDDVVAYFDRYVWTGLEMVSVSNGRVENVRALGDALRISVDVSMDEYVVRTGDVLILQPMLMRSLIQNPFLAERRTAPVALPYPIWEAHMLGLRIPEGYEVAQAPESIRVIMPGDAGQFIYNVLLTDNILHVTSSIEINRTRYSPEEYQGIRDFFEYIVKKHEEDIVIKKVQ